MKVVLFNGEPRISDKDLAFSIGKAVKTIRGHLRQYRSEFAEFGSIYTMKDPGTLYMLNVGQALMLITYCASGHDVLPGVIQKLLTIHSTVYPEQRKTVPIILPEEVVQEQGYKHTDHDLTPLCLQKNKSLTLPTGGTYDSFRGKCSRIL